MGRPLDGLNFDATYCPVAVLSCAFFLYIYRYASPKLSSKLCPQYNQLSDALQVDWDNRVNSTVHSMIVSCMCAYTLLYDEEISENPIWWDSPMVRTSCATVVGFMAADVVIMAVQYKHIGEVFYILHHGASIYAYYYVMTYGVLPYFANYRLMAEFSTPFVNQRWFLAQLGYEKIHPVFVSNGLAMMATFFVVRVAVMPAYWHKVYSVYNTVAFTRLGYMQWCLIIPCLILDTINLYWFHKICSGAFKILSLCLQKDKKGRKSPDGSKFFGTTWTSFISKKPLVHSHSESDKHID